MAFGGLYFSNREFHRLIARVETVFESSLTIMNAFFSGASLVADLLSQLKENNHIREAMRSMLPTGTTEVELKWVLHYVLRTYTRMRGKNYVRRLMSRSKASLEGENIRSAIAVKAGIARNTTARHAKNKKRTNTSTHQGCVTMRQLVSNVSLNNDESEEEN
jgi:hypothetical protein